MPLPNAVDLYLICVLQKSLHYGNLSVFAKTQIYDPDIFGLNRKLALDLRMNHTETANILCALYITFLVFAIICLKK